MLHRLVKPVLWLIDKVLNVIFRLLDKIFGDEDIDPIPNLCDPTPQAAADIRDVTRWYLNPFTGELVTSAALKVIQCENPEVLRTFILVPSIYHTQCEKLSWSMKPLSLRDTRSPLGKCASNLRKKRKHLRGRPAQYKGDI